MRILFLSQIVPFPLDAGPKVKTYNVLRHLVDAGHEVVMVSFFRPHEQNGVEAIRQLCKEVHLIPIKRNRILEPWYLLRSLWKRQPFLIERDYRAEFQQKVQQLLTEQHFDLIHADQVNMTQFAQGFDLSGNYPALVFDAHNADWVILKRMATESPWFLKPFLLNEAKLLKSYEGRIVRDFDITLAVSEIDRLALDEAYQTTSSSSETATISVIPIAVDTKKVCPIQRQRGSKRILTLGTLHYLPNADGIRWFIREVLPVIRKSIPDVKFSIIGRNPPKDFVELANQEPELISVPGYVDDLTKWFEQASAIIVPVRVGGGMRVRILEAFAYQMPVVTTTVGLEGINALPGRDVLVEDEPVNFANAVIQVIQDQVLQDQIAQNGRCLVESQYDWQVVLNRLDEAYQQALKHREQVKIQ